MRSEPEKAFTKGGSWWCRVGLVGRRGGHGYLLEQKTDLEEIGTGTGRVPEVVLGGILAVRKDLNNFSFKLVPTKTWCHGEKR